MTTLLSEIEINRIKNAMEVFKPNEANNSEFACCRLPQDRGLRVKIINMINISHGKPVQFSTRLNGEAIVVYSITTSAAYANGFGFNIKIDYINPDHITKGISVNPNLSIKMVGTTPQFHGKIKQADGLRLDKNDYQTMRELLKLLPDDTANPNVSSLASFTLSYGEHDTLIKKIYDEFDEVDSDSGCPLYMFDICNENATEARFAVVDQVRYDIDNKSNDYIIHIDTKSKEYRSSRVSELEINDQLNIDTYRVCDREHQGKMKVSYVFVRPAALAVPLVDEHTPTQEPLTDDDVALIIERLHADHLANTTQACMNSMITLYPDSDSHRDLFEKLTLMHRLANKQDKDHDVFTVQTVNAIGIKLKIQQIIPSGDWVKVVFRCLTIDMAPTRRLYINDRLSVCTVTIEREVDVLDSPFTNHCSMGLRKATIFLPSSTKVSN